MLRIPGMQEAVNDYVETASGALLKTPQVGQVPPEQPVPQTGEQPIV